MCPPSCLRLFACIHAYAYAYISGHAYVLFQSTPLCLACALHLSLYLTIRFSPFLSFAPCAHLLDLEIQGSPPYRSLLRPSGPKKVSESVCLPALGSKKCPKQHSLELQSSLEIRRLSWDCFGHFFDPGAVHAWNWVHLWFWSFSPNVKVILRQDLEMVPWKHRAFAVGFSQFWWPFSYVLHWRGSPCRTSSWSFSLEFLQFCCAESWKFWAEVLAEVFFVLNVPAKQARKLREKLRGKLRQKLRPELPPSKTETSPKTSLCRAPLLSITVYWTHKCAMLPDVKLANFDAKMTLRLGKSTKRTNKAILTGPHPGAGRPQGPWRRLSWRLL